MINHPNRSKYTHTYSDAPQVQAKHPGLWSSDGSLGIGFIHPPKTTQPVANVDNYLLKEMRGPMLTVMVNEASPSAPWMGRCIVRYNEPVEVVDYAKGPGNMLMPLAGMIFKNEAALIEHLKGAGWLVVKSRNNGNVYLAH